MKSRHIVLARTPEILEAGVHTGKGHRKFNKKASAFHVTDPAEAREIEQKYKGQVAVTLDQQYTRFVNNDSGEVHNYFFAGVDMSEIKTTQPPKSVWVEFAPKRWRLEKVVSDGANT